jgi:beta-lactam-binding protein with PASTA domain
LPPSSPLQSRTDALPVHRALPQGRSTTSKSITHAPAAGDTEAPALVTLDGRYHVLERIAAGGMGEVFRAHDAVLAREVAIKVLHRSLAGDQGFVERFRREARAAATLNHPNIVAVYDWGAVDGIYYMVMEYVRGRGVRDILNVSGRMEPSQAADVVRQTLVALQHAHGHGIVHRDLKPENILITGDGVVKLTDLGLARAYADGTATGTGQVTGTVQYLAPEQIRGEPADPRSDLYSLGIVMFELLTGRLPFTGETPMSIAYKHLSDRVPAPSSVSLGIPRELDGFVASATDRDRELRPESAAEMRRDLEGMIPHLSAARSLAAVVEDLPDVTAREQDTEVVAAATTTASIPRLRRRRLRRLRRFLAWFLALAIVTGAAWGVWTYAVPHEATVPNLVGATVADAQSALDDLGLGVRLAEGAFDEQVPEGSVLEMDPDAGTVLEQGDVVTLMPSLGPPPVPVPSVVGKDLDDATRLLERGDLVVGKIRRRFHDQVAAGAVISQRPLSGELPMGSTVDLVVSRGHAPERIPNVVGKSFESAERALGSLGFEVKVEEAHSNDVPRGRVISVDPEAGTTQDYGSSVTVTVSIGPRFFPCPTFIGLSKGAAEALASRSGLEIAFLTVPGTDGSHAISQLPTAGSRVEYGQTITLYMA